MMGDTFELASAGLDGEVRDVLRESVMGDGCLSLTVEGGRAVLETAPGDTFEREILFSGISGMPDGTYDMTGLDDPRLYRSRDAYTLTWENCGGEGRGLALSFTGTALRSRIFRPEEPLSGKPWEWLRSASWGIFEKKLVSEELLDRRERELLPLAEELCGLSGPAGVYGELSGPGFPALTEVFEKYGCEELISLLGEVSASPEGGKERVRAAEKLAEGLNEAKAEPVWRELYGAFASAWRDVPSRAELHMTPEKLGAARERISGLLASRGYKGEYPDFVRTGPISGVRLANAYGKTYFVGPERMAAFHTNI